MQESSRALREGPSCTEERVQLREWQGEQDTVSNCPPVCPVWTVATDALDVPQESQQRPDGGAQSRT